MKFRLLFWLLIISNAAFGQSKHVPKDTVKKPVVHWRIGGGAGISTVSIADADSKGVSLLVNAGIARVSPRHEYGFLFQATQFRGNGTLEFGSGAITSIAYLTNYYAKTAYPLLAFYNIARRTSRTYAFLGVNAGIVLAKHIDNTAYSVDTLISRGPAGTNIYFSSSTGYAGGVQFGLRYHVSSYLDLGLQGQIDFISMKFNGDTINSHYSGTININPPSLTIYLPLSFNVGFCF